VARGFKLLGLAEQRCGAGDCTWALDEDG
jgi:hypothetical protein